MAPTVLDSARAKRLTRLFWDVLKGLRQIKTGLEAQLFLEAVRAQNPPTTCLENIASNHAGLQAVAQAVRCDLSTLFIRSHTLPLIAYLSEPSLKTLCNGKLLQQHLTGLFYPPIVWKSLQRLYLADELQDSELPIFAWLCLELASLPGVELDDIVNDIVTTTKTRPLLELENPDARKLAYRLQKVLNLRSSSSPVGGQDSPGGRHDNDHADFRLIHVYPTCDELLSTETPFYRNAAEVASTELEQRAKVHLDNQFRLLREDMLAELREDVKVATGRKKGRRSFNILGDLQPVRIDTGDERRSRACALLVSCKTGLESFRKKNKTERTKFLAETPNFLRRQAFGALCHGADIICFAFIVREVDFLLCEPPLVGLQFTDAQAFVRALLAFRTSQNLRFVLVDTPVYAYQPVLDCLQQIPELPLDMELLALPSELASDSPLTAPERSHDAQVTVDSLKQLLEKSDESFELGNKKYRLDESQLQSVIHAVENCLTLIQGPPGTGKSFIGAIVANILLTGNTNTKILVLSYTNHALDQFLEDLMKIGIPTSDMVRLGSKCTEATAPLALDKRRETNYRGRTRASWDLINSLRQRLDSLRGDLETACEKYIRFSVDSSDILDSLEFSGREHPFYEAFLVPEDQDGFKLAGKGGKVTGRQYLYDRWARGQDAGFLQRQIQNCCQAVWNMPHATRHRFVESWTAQLRKEQLDAVRNLTEQFNDTQAELDAAFGEAQRINIQSKRVIGCTTTGAAMYKSLIKAAKPDVVMVEEAGEILEAHVLTALHPAMSQLILIGDHLQLRPKINNYALSVEKGEGYDLNRSLFERLIRQGHPHTTLKKQHRMHPDISCLVREMTYPDLLDDNKTINRKAIKGLQGRVSFVNHDHHETEVSKLADRRDEEAKLSKMNQFEAETVLRLVKYLGQQGYGTGNIVVLTPYLGQLRLLRDMLSRDNDPLLNDLDSAELLRAGLLTSAAAKIGQARIKLSTIDNYQGEESDIVIASLTRSNSTGDIGFMKAPERLNVLVSRARDCLVMIGNMDTFMASKQGHKTWTPFFNLLRTKGYLHDGVLVRCEKHPDRTAILRLPDDFDKHCPDGGCSELCGAMLSCGKHNCLRRCHRVSDHSMIKCNHPLDKVCEKKHTYKVPCANKNDACGKCRKEEEDLKRRIQRDLDLERSRAKRQSEYAKKLQQVQDEIESERRRMKYEKEEEEEKKTLSQQQADLRALKETRARMSAMIQATAAQTAANKMSGTSTKSESKAADLSIIPGSAREDWEHMKRHESVKSEPLDSLMAMIGLEIVKTEFLGIQTTVDTKIRKTTVARIYGQFLASAGVIPGSCFKETTGSKLSNLGVSGCQKLLDEVLNNGGGIIFIDEAYQLTSGNNPGGFAVLDFLLAEVENLTGKVVFVMAGYVKQMETFFAHNPGLPSRFPREMKFEDYNDDELLKILGYQINKKYNGRMDVEGGLSGLYCRVVARRVGRSRGKEGFGNARAVENIVARICDRQASRLKIQRRAGKAPNDMLLVKEDLIGPQPSEALTGSKAWSKLKGLIGLKTVKESVKVLTDSIETNYRRELAEEPVIEYSMNKVFLGSPGTGKTTVAKLYGQILADLGLLSKAEVIIKNPSDFVGSVIGGSEQQTKGILAATAGKILVIDEAYGLYGGGSNSGVNDPYKTAVIDTIVAEVQSTPGEDRCVLLLGYKDQMEAMFQNVNPGLSRRFPISSAFVFEDFDSAELAKILDLKLKQQAFHATDQAKKAISEELERARCRPNFGNAGEVDIILDRAKTRHQQRLSSGLTKNVSTLEALDVDENFDRAERTEGNVSNLFEGTVGCEKIIKILQGYQDTVRTLKRLGMDPREDIPFNFLFRGPPGTGKTTTARKMGKVFYDMGVLANVEVHECSATDLIGEYVGQTGPKVQALLDKALGRVLFIDEAYRLSEGHFAKEAVDELVDCVTKEKYRNKLVIILAGYDEDINRLLSVNPGMSSRFPVAIEFQSLEPAQCFTLLIQRLQKERQRIRSNKATFEIDCLESPTTEFRLHVVNMFQVLSLLSNWASARDVGNVAKCIFNASLKSLASRSDARIIVTEAVVKAELNNIIQEREYRTKHTSAALSSMTERLPVQDANPRDRTPVQHTTATAQGVSIEDSAEDDHPLESVPDQKKRADDNALRDAGVSDAVWEQLQRDKQAEEEREECYRSLLKASRDSKETERQKIVQQLLQEDERRKREAEVQKKLTSQGLCPAGYRWIKEASGYRCAGGSHSISDTQINKM